MIPNRVHRDILKHFVVLYLFHAVSLAMEEVGLRISICRPVHVSNTDYIRIWFSAYYFIMPLKSSSSQYPTIVMCRIAHAFMTYSLSTVNHMLNFLSKRLPEFYNRLLMPCFRLGTVL